jgi:hypothetical protein
MMNMDKVKVALTVLSIMLIAAPLLGVVYVYRDNLIGLVLHPEVTDMMNGNTNQTSPMGDFELPSVAGEPQYNSQTGAFNLAFNFTNPLTNDLSVDKFSATIKSRDNNAVLGNVALAEPISVASGENSILSVAGNLDQNTVNQLVSQYQGNRNLNVVLEDVDAIVGGIHFHLDQIDIGSITLPEDSP